MSARNVRTWGQAMFLAGLLAAGLLSWETARARAFPSSGIISFDVARDGVPGLGHHHVTFRHEGRDLIVDTLIRYRVRLAFITLFRYEHSSREVWRGGRLMAVEGKTHDNRRDHWMRGHAVAEGFRVEGSRGSFIAPADVIPASHWNVAMVGARQLLDTQRGLLMDVRVRDAGREKVEAGGRTIRAKRYRVEFLSNAPRATKWADIWYDEGGNWVKLAFEARKSTIVYRLKPA